MGDAQWGYNDEVAARAGVPPMPRSIQAMYQDTSAARSRGPGYREREYAFDAASDSWSVTEPGEPAARPASQL